MKSPRQPAPRLAYTCNLNSSDGQVNYQFVVHPAGQLDIPLWLAKISLDANSSLVIANDANGMAVKSHLNGSISMDIAVKGFPTVTLPGLDFQDMAMANRHDTTPNAAAGFYFDPGKWSLGGVDLSGLPAPPLEFAWPILDDVACRQAAVTLRHVRRPSNRRALAAACAPAWPAC